MTSPLGSTEHVQLYRAIGSSPTFTHLLVSGWYLVEMEPLPNTQPKEQSGIQKTLTDDGQSGVDEMGPLTSASEQPTSRPRLVSPTGLTLKVLIKVKLRV